MEEWMWIVWLSIFLVTIIVEVSTDALVSVWFSVASLLCLGFCFIPGLPFWGEIILFLGISLLCFFLLRPWLAKRLKRRIVKTNVDSIVGETALVLSWDDPMHGGTVEVRGVTWNALPVRDELEFLAGDRVKIVMLNGNKLLIDGMKKE